MAQNVLYYPPSSRDGMNTARKASTRHETHIIARGENQTSGPGGENSGNERPRSSSIKVICGSKQAEPAASRRPPQWCYDSSGVLPPRGRLCVCCPPTMILWLRSPHSATCSGGTGGVDASRAFHQRRKHLSFKPGRLRLNLATPPAPLPRL